MYEDVADSEIDSNHYRMKHVMAVDDVVVALTSMQVLDLFHMNHRDCLDYMTTRKSINKQTIEEFSFENEFTICCDGCCCC